MVKAYKSVAQAPVGRAAITRIPIRSDQASANHSLRTKAYALTTEAVARAFQTPQYLILFVSDQCWMKCAHCWFNEAWKEAELTQPALTFDEYERVAQSMSRVTFLSITGGEAFHRADIAELATMVCKSTRVGRYQIPTSGYRTDKILADTEKMLLANPNTPLRIDVSLDGPRDIHNEIRRIRDGYERAIETIAALTKLKRKHAHFDVGVITTISKSNQHVVAEMAALVETVHPAGEWMINIARGASRDPAAIEVNPEAYREAHLLLQARIERGKYNGHSGHLAAKWLSAKNAARREIIYDIVTGKREGGGCAAGAAAGVIHSDGEVRACEMLDDSMGNVRNFDYDLRRMWQSHGARALRDRIQTTRCQCTQECFLSTSMLLSPDAWRRMTHARWTMGNSKGTS
jgi:MoaA/NifB/PqqE/SkfB family radical SAM enzyme